MLYNNWIAYATKSIIDWLFELDVNQKVINMTKPLSELYVFNYKDKLYLYVPKIYDYNN